MCEWQAVLEKSDGDDSDRRDSFWIFERLVPLWVVCTRHTRRTCDGDLFVLSLCTVLKSSFSFLLFLMPLWESECDRKGLGFFITLFCIVSLKLINIPIEIVIFVLGSYRLGYKAYIDIPNSLPAVGPGLNFGFPGLWDTIVSVSLFPAPLWFVFTFAL